MAGAIAFLVALILAVGALTIREVLLFRGGTHVITPAAYVLRLVNGVLLLTILGMLLYGTVALPGAPPNAQLSFWSLCVILFFVSVVIGINDLRMLRKVHRDRSKQIWKRIMGAPGDDGRHEPK